MENTNRVSLKILLPGIVFLAVAIGVFAWIVSFPSSASRKVVATINNQEITLAEVDESVMLAKQWFESAGIDLSEKEVLDNARRNALQIIINNKLMLEDAHQIGISTSTQAVEKAFSEVEELFPSKEDFDSFLEEMNLSKESLAQKIKEELILESYLETQLQISTIVVTEDEILTAKNLLSEAVAETDPAEVRLFLIQELKKQKIQRAQTVLIGALRSKAQIWVDDYWQLEQ